MDVAHYSQSNSVETSHLMILRTQARFVGCEQDQRTKREHGATRRPETMQVLLLMVIRDSVRVMSLSHI